MTFWVQSSCSNMPTIYCLNHFKNFFYKFIRYVFLWFAYFWKIMTWSFLRTLKNFLLKCSDPRISSSIPVIIKSSESTSIFKNSYKSKMLNKWNHLKWIFRLIPVVWTATLNFWLLIDSFLWHSALNCCTGTGISPSAGVHPFGLSFCTKMKRCAMTNGILDESFHKLQEKIPEEVNSCLR